MGAHLNCVQFTHGMIHNMEFTGVSLRTLLNEARVKPEGTWVYVEGANAASNGRSIPMEKALDDVLLAFKANGESLDRFYLDHVSDGSKMLGQSRAIDSTGCVLPTKTELRDVRGLNSVYHINCIQT